jgi:hypothetical protein
LHTFYKIHVNLWICLNSFTIIPPTVHSRRKGMISFDVFFLIRTTWRDWWWLQHMFVFRSSFYYLILQVSQSQHNWTNFNHYLFSIVILKQWKWIGGIVINYEILFLSKIYYELSILYKSVEPTNRVSHQKDEVRFSWELSAIIEFQSSA